MLQRFRDGLGAVGYADPRLKVLPPLLIGEEAERNRGYRPDERITHEMMHGYDLDQLLCTSARLVTADGVYACPILLDYPSARLAGTLTEAVGMSASLCESACYTCYVNGAICSNATTGTGEPEACDAGASSCDSAPAACDGEPAALDAEPTACDAAPAACNGAPASSIPEPVGCQSVSGS